MMHTRQELTNFLDSLFADYKVQDYSNNGLQVEGKETVRKAAFAVLQVLSRIAQSARLTSIG